MSATVAITRTDLTSTELRRAAGKCRDATAARRMLALALALEGADRFGVTVHEQTVDKY